MIFIAIFPKGLSNISKNMNISLIVNVFDASIRLFSIILFISSFFYDTIHFSDQIFEILNFFFLAIYTLVDILCILFFILEFHILYRGFLTFYRDSHDYTDLSTFLIDKYFSKKVPVIKFLISIYFFFIFLKLSENNFQLCFKYNIQTCLSVGIIIVSNFITFLVFKVIDCIMEKVMEKRSPKIHIKEPRGIICSICIDECEEQKNKAWIQVRCKHKFHDTCIDEWLKISKTCPNCRINV